jgi:hypothetical protein
MVPQWSVPAGLRLPPSSGRTSPTRTASYSATNVSGGLDSTEIPRTLSDSSAVVAVLLGMTLGQKPSRGLRVGVAGPGVGGVVALVGVVLRAGWRSDRFGRSGVGSRR